MDANEAKVRAAWEPGELRVSGRGSPDEIAEVWKSAAEFTAARQQQIDELDEEITCVKEGCDLCDGAIGPGLLANSRVGAIYQRILTRLQAARAELTRGMVTPQPKESQ